MAEAEPKTPLARANTLLLVLIILIDGYIAVAPLLPSFLYSWHHGQAAKLQQDLRPKGSTAAPASPQPNHLVIPNMLLDAPVFDGPIQKQYQILDKGIWRLSTGSSPNKGGNTVLVGHRFTYTNPKGIFYYLNKLKTGDEIGLWWSDKEYLYKVATINIVPPTDTAIESPSKQPELTLFTCTPLWWPKNRLVVVAYPESGP